MTIRETIVRVRYRNFGDCHEVTLADAIACLSGHLDHDEPAHERLLRTGEASSSGADYLVVETGGEVVLNG